MNMLVCRVLSLLLVFQSFSYAQSKVVTDRKASPPKIINTPTFEEIDPEKSETKKSEILQADPHKNESLFLNSLDYPELQVVPRASERLQMDVAKEQEKGWYLFWPFHVASGTTLLAALMHKNRFNPLSESD